MLHLYMLDGQLYKPIGQKISPRPVGGPLVYRGPRTIEGVERFLQDGGIAADAFIFSPNNFGTDQNDLVMAVQPYATSLRSRARPSFEPFVYRGTRKDLERAVRCFREGVDDPQLLGNALLGPRTVPVGRWRLSHADGYWAVQCYRPLRQIAQS